MIKPSKTSPRIGFVLLPHYNDSSLLAGQTHLPRCPKCKELLVRECPVDHFKLKKKRDLSCSLDSRVFGSARFKDIWTSEGGQGLEFVELPAQPGYYFLKAQEVLEFDAVRRQCLGENFCRTCKQYDAFVGATPGYLKHPDRLKGNHAYRSDLNFGSNDHRSPLLMVGLQIGLKLKQARLSGWCARDVLL